MHLTPPARRALIGALAAVLVVSGCDDDPAMVVLDGAVDGPADGGTGGAPGMDSGSDSPRADADPGADGDGDASGEGDATTDGDPGDATGGDDGPSPGDAVAAQDGGDGAGAPDADPIADALAGDARALVPNPAAVRILPAGTDLLGSFQTGCTFGPGADRWCAVSRPGAGTDRELWLVNATRLGAMGTSLADCATPGLCLRAAGRLYTARPEGGPAYPEDVARASGNTFIYLTDPVSDPVDAFKGDVWVHTVGAPQATRIGDDVFDCAVSGRRYIDLGKRLVDKVVGLCATGPASDPFADPNFFTLTGGVVAGQDVPLVPSSAPPVENPGGELGTVTTIFPVHPGTQAARWRAGFTADGETLVVSNGGATLAEAENIYTIPTDDIGKPGVSPTLLPGGEGATRWTLSADNEKIFYFKEYNYNAAGSQSGTLIAADFPTGANARELRSSRVPGGPAGGIGAYRLLVDQDGLDAGLGYLSAMALGQGDYSIVRDPGGDLEDPANVVPVAQASRSLPLPSPRLDFSVFARVFPQDTPTSDIWIVRNDGTEDCQLTGGTLGGVFGFPFTASSQLVFWVDNYDAPTLSGEGWLTEPADCRNESKKKQFARNIDFWFVDSDRLLLYSDESDGAQVTLKYAAIAGNTLGPPVTIQTGADRFFHIVLDEQPAQGPPRFKAVLYTLSGSGPATDGVYYYPLPTF
jgi:hypothetical protein